MVFLGWFVGLFLLSLPFSFCLAFVASLADFDTLFFGQYTAFYRLKKKKSLLVFCKQTLVSDSPKL